VKLWPAILMLALVAGGAAAQSLGPAAPPKYERPTRSTHDHQIQGGDTFADAFPIDALPFTHTGTTAGYTDDYDEVCPYSGSIAPDVVYRLCLDHDAWVDIDMCGSAYDTKIYVYGAGMELVACNDDFYYDDECGVYVSKLELVALAAGVKYFLVVDGYGEAAGDYQLLVEEQEPCVLECPPYHQTEGEPDLVDDYADSWNGGCNSPAFGHPFQTIYGGYPEAVFCGVAGWYSYYGTPYRDTDWFVATVGFDGYLDITFDAEFETRLFELWPQDCATLEVRQSMTAGPCDDARLLTYDYAEGQPVWLWVGSAIFEAPPQAPDNAYDYVLWIDGIWYQPQPAATERATWGAVKSLYR